MNNKYEPTQPLNVLIDRLVIKLNLSNRRGKVSTKCYVDKGLLEDALCYLESFRAQQSSMQAAVDKINDKQAKDSMELEALLNEIDTLKLNKKKYKTRREIKLFEATKDKIHEMIVIHLSKS